MDKKRKNSKNSEILSRALSSPSQHSGVYRPIEAHGRQHREGLREFHEKLFMGFFTHKQIVIGLCLGEIWIGLISFLFAYYGIGSLINVTLRNYLYDLE